MIADDTAAIREAMRKLAQAKVQAEAEAARKAATDDSATTLPKQRPLFDESGTPFRGFFVTEDGDIKPVKPANLDSAFDQDAWDAWDDATLDSGVTADTAPQFMWGKIDADLPSPYSNWTVPNGAPFREWVITDTGDIKPVGWIWHGNGKRKGTR